MIQSFTLMSERVKRLGRQRIAVAAAQDEELLRSIAQAWELGIADPILIGNKGEIEKIAAGSGLDLAPFDLIDEPDDRKACRLAVRLVRQGAAGSIMKGLVGTGPLLKEILDRETGLRDRKLLSHVGLFSLASLGRSILITDAALTIAPDLSAKKQLIENAVGAARLLGADLPKVACVCALERVNPAMTATQDAAELVQMNRRGEIEDCLVGGPFALDNALFIEAARHKRISDPVAGDPDILLLPDIEAGNVLYKALSLLCEAPSAGVVLGAKAPIIVTSRSDKGETKLNSILLALYLAAAKEI